MKKNRVLAICLKTYVDEDDMRSFCDGDIELDDVKIYFKGGQYLVYPNYDEKYYKLLE